MTPTSRHRRRRHRCPPRSTPIRNPTSRSPRPPRSGRSWRSRARSSASRRRTSSPTATTRPRCRWTTSSRCKDKPNGKLILVSAITPTPAGEGKTTTTVGLTDALNHIGKKAMLCLREPSLGPVVRHEGRRGRRRLRPGRADGGHQSPFHRRLPRHHLGAQSALRADRQPHLLGQRARHRQPPRRLAARDGHERPRAARDRLLARRRRQRLPARGRLRHHGGVGGDGDLLPRQAISTISRSASATSSSPIRATANRCARATSRRTAR